MKKLYIETYGCQMNVADSEVVASVMQMAGYEPTESLEEADAVFLNTCSVRDNAEQKIYHRLEALNALRRQRRNTPPSSLLPPLSSLLPPPLSLSVSWAVWLSV
jgi:tRNA-2-methylthio-N6-dimethylallyladenosine synthase